MRLRRLAVALVWITAPLLAGCLQCSTLVKLNPDGSGTIERTTTMKADLYAQLHTPATGDLFSVGEARTAAADMGGGVTFVSAARIDTPAVKGIKAVYAFKDIGAVSLSEFNPPASLDVGGGSGPITFTFTRLPNGHSLLTIKNDIDGFDDAMAAGTASAAKRPSADDKDKDKEEREVTKAMLAGLKIDFAIQVDQMVKTNAPYVSGGTVTLMSMDFDRVMASPSAFEKANKASSTAGSIAALREVKGIKITLDPELTIEFGK